MAYKTPQGRMRPAFVVAIKPGATHETYDLMYYDVQRGAWRHVGERLAIDASDFAEMTRDWEDAKIAEESLSWETLDERAGLICRYDRVVRSDINAVSLPEEGETPQGVVVKTRDDCVCVAWTRRGAP